MAWRYIQGMHKELVTVAMVEMALIAAVERPLIGGLLVLGGIHIFEKSDASKSRD